MSPAAGSTPAPAILACHLGFLCGARKRVVVPAAVAGAAGAFEIQDLARIEAEGLGSGDVRAESWAPAFRGTLVRHAGPMGSWLVGDFSPLRAPGVYRAALPGGAVSYPFVISEGAWSRLPSLFLDYVHGRRCGDFEDELRGPCHLDDGLRSDTGAPIDAAGGWHDAGDLRKWMVTTPLPILGFFELRDRQGFSRNAWRERPHEDDILAEASWGLRWILKMQDPVTGMFFEDVGGGGDSRRVQGMDWWQENHAGCCADNAENRWTDNRHSSGDERHVRAQYNPIAQYVNATILLDAAAHFHPHYPAFSALCRQAALKNWEFMKGRKRDSFHRWASVLSWRLLAALRLHAVGVVAESEVAAIVSVLIDLQSADGGFWYMDAERKEPYRGILHAAQPAIALAEFVESDYENPLASQARDRLELHWTRYVQPMLATNPFGMMPYGLFSAPGPGTDAYHPWDHGPGKGLCYRFFMPTQRPGGIVHGLAAHWTSWAHAFSGLARVLECDGCRQAGFDQLSWLLGGNPLGASAVTGVGYRNVVPYSRFQGPAQGGFCNGFRGNAEDEVQSDLDGALDWTTGEYWMAPLASALLALAGLVPQGGLTGALPGAHAGVLPSSKLGAPG